MSELKPLDQQLTIIDEEGNEVLCQILFTFESEEFKKNYVLFYPLDDSDDEENVTVMAASYVEGENGIGELQEIETDEEWDFTIATDETSVFKMTRAFANIMKKNKYGRIINIASMYGLVGNTEIHTIAYHTSKGAVVNFTRAVAAELATQGITCNAICPGYFETELTKAVLDTPRFQEFAKIHVPMERYGKPGELDAAAVFLASEEASYVTGLIMPVDGGYTAI